MQKLRCGTEALYIFLLLLLIWVNDHLSNWLWLKDLAKALNKEYRYRFYHERNHKSYEVILTLGSSLLVNLGLTERPQALPDEFKNTDLVQAYWIYYKERKRHLTHWTKREIPVWFMKR